MTHIFKFVEGSLIKNNGISIFILVDMYIQKWMVIGQHVFDKENWLNMKFFYLEMCSGRCFLQLEV